MRHNDDDDNDDDDDHADEQADSKWHTFCAQYSRLKSNLCLWVDLSLVLDQYLCHRNMILLCGQVHRSQTILSTTVAVGTPVQQQSYHVSVTFL